MKNLVVLLVLVALLVGCASVSTTEEPSFPNTSILGFREDLTKEWSGYVWLAHDKKGEPSVDAMVRVNLHRTVRTGETYRHENLTTVGLKRLGQTDKGWQFEVPADWKYAGWKKIGTTALGTMPLNGFIGIRDEGVKKLIGRYSAREIWQFKPERDSEGRTIIVVP